MMMTIDVEAISPQMMSSSMVSTAGNVSSSLPGALCGDKEVHTGITAPIVMSAFGIVGNVLALIVLYKTRTERRRSAFYTLVAGLALTDLLGQLFTSPIAIAAYSSGLTLLEPEEHPGLCSFHGFLMVGFGLATPLIVCLMALERISALCIDIYGSHFMSLSRVRAALGVSWGFAMCFAALPLVGFGCYERQYPCSWCFLKFHFDLARVNPNVTSSTSWGMPSTNTSCGDGDGSGWHLPAAYACVYAVINLTVISLTIVCNFVVIIVLLRMRKRRKLLSKSCKRVAGSCYSNSSPPALNRENHQPPNQRSSRAACRRDQGDSPKRNSADAGSRERRESQVAQDLELQMVWLVCGMTLTFTICWTPFMCQILMSVIPGTTKSSQSPADMLALRLAVVNQILDPWLYIILRRSLFRRVGQGISRVFNRGGGGDVGRVEKQNQQRRVVNFARRRYEKSPGMLGEKAQAGHEKCRGLNANVMQPDGALVQVAHAHNIERRHSEDDSSFTRTSYREQEKEKLMPLDENIELETHVMSVCTSPSDSYVTADTNNCINGVLTSPDLLGHALSNAR